MNMKPRLRLAICSAFLLVIPAMSGSTEDPPMASAPLPPPLRASLPTASSAETPVTGPTYQGKAEPSDAHPASHAGAPTAQKTPPIGSPKHDAVAAAARSRPAKGKEARAGRRHQQGSLPNHQKGPTLADA